MTTDDRDALIDVTADSLETAFDRAVATPEGRAAYDELRQLGGTISVNGGIARRINLETGELSGGEDGTASTATNDHSDHGDATADPARDRRLAGLVWEADPDARVYPPEYASLTVGEQGTITHRSVDLPFAESPFLARIGAALIARDAINLSSLDRWGIRVAYLWADDLGRAEGELRLWRLKKASPDLVWALGQSRERRVVDLFVFLNARIVRYAQLTNWQIQAALHTALGHARVRQGKLAIEQPSAVWQRRLIRRYGVDWHPNLAALYADMKLAEADQLALWPEDEDGDDE